MLHILVGDIALAFKPGLSTLILRIHMHFFLGRHGMKFGHGTYFSTSAVYSTRFCDRRRPERLMFLASVLVGRSAKGSPELIEPPHRDDEGIVRYDSTVDDINNPSIFCVFRDYQAMPLYLIHFTSTDHSSAATC